MIKWSQFIQTGSINGIDSIPLLQGGNNKIINLDSLKLSSLNVPDYIKSWDASLNSPSLTSGVGLDNSLYIVNKDGNYLLDGISTWRIGDILYFDGTKWNKYLSYPMTSYMYNPYQLDLFSEQTQLFTDNDLPYLRFINNSKIYISINSNFGIDNEKDIYINIGYYVTNSTSGELVLNFFKNTINQSLIKSSGNNITRQFNIASNEYKMSTFEINGLNLNFNELLNFNITGSLSTNQLRILNIQVLFFNK